MVGLVLPHCDGLCFLVSAIGLGGNISPCNLFFVLRIFFFCFKGIHVDDWGKSDSIWHINTAFRPGGARLCYLTGV